MEYGNNKLIITEDSIRELVGFVMDVQDELTKAQFKLEMLEKYYRNKPHFLTEEVKLILGIDESKSAGEVLKELENKGEYTTPTATEKETKKEYLVNMPEGSVPY